MARRDRSAASLRQSNVAKRVGGEAAGAATEGQNWQVHLRFSENDRVVWDTSRDGQVRWRFTNASSNLAELVCVEEAGVSDQEKSTMLLPGQKDEAFGPEQGFVVLIEKPAASPAITELEVTWLEGKPEVKEKFLPAR